MTGAANALPDLSLHNTSPKLLRWNAETRGDRPCLREKHLGIWETMTWSEAAARVREIACGLATLGLERGDRVSIIGDNRPVLYNAILAIQSLGGVPVPIYQDSVADETRYVLNNAEVRFVFAENQEQVDKVLEIKDDCPTIEGVIYDDPRGLRNYRQEFLCGTEDLMREGRARDAEHPEFYDAEVARGAAEDTSVILYTSGTTGNPKGVVLSYRNVLVSALNSVRLEGLGETDEVLAYLPMAWVGDHMFSCGQALAAGFCVSCPESSDTVLNDLWEVGPTYFFAPPRIFENVLTTVMIRIQDSGWVKRKLFFHFLEVAKLYGKKILDGEKVGPVGRFHYALGSLLIYRPLMNTLGLTRVKLGYTAGEAIGPDIFDFYRSIGFNLKQLYGMTEASVFITIQPNGEVRSDTVGRPATEVELRIEGNEVQFRGPGVFVEYFRNPEATSETKTEDGWCRTGDAGFIDGEGHLKIIDRAKDVGRLHDGTLFAPKYIENKLKFFPDIFEAVGFGHERDFVTAFVNIDLEAMGDWAERNGISYASYQELAGLPQVYDIVQRRVEQVNRDLAADADLAGAQIRRFLVLHKQLDADDGELTRTRKVRRRHVSEKYGSLIEALYSGQDRCGIETEVTFEDGRKGTVRADLQIRDVAPAEPERSAA